MDTLPTATGLLANLSEAVQTSSIQVCTAILEKDQTALHKIGWHSFTAFHFACLRGDMSIVTLLVDRGADVNARNDDGETPLLMACAKGSLILIQYLLDKSADINVVESNGRGVMHYAARNLYALHYLSQVHNMSCDVLDNCRQSPLHIASYSGYNEVVKFLLKKQRSVIDQADKNGNLPIHLAARQGHGYLTWLLLSHDTCQMLHVTNSEGFTPVDLAKQNKHQPTEELLTHYTSVKDRDHQPKGPILAWYWHLALPTVFYWISLALGVTLGNYIKSQGLVVFIGVGVMARILRQHIHRLKHVCRWPNPMYAGMFAGGLLNTILCFLVIMSWEMHVFILLNAITILPLELYMYWVLLTRDPGYILVAR